MYTAEFDGVRASWVVRPDGSATGVQFSPTTGQKLEQSDLQQLADDQFRAQVRNTRKLQQAQQITKLPNGSMSSTINGTQVTPTLVNGTFRLSDNRISLSPNGPARDRINVRTGWAVGLCHLFRLAGPTRKLGNAKFPISSACWVLLCLLAPIGGQADVDEWFAA